MNSETPLTDAVILEHQYSPFCGAPVMSIVPANKMRALELRCKRLEEALRPFATLEFDKTYQGQTNPQAKIFGVNETSITGSDILAAREALTPPTTI